jgi:hypothetical protein
LKLNFSAWYDVQETRIEITAASVRPRMTITYAQFGMIRAGMQNKAHMAEQRKAYWVLVGNPERNRPHGTPSHPQY